MTTVIMKIMEDFDTAMMAGNWDEALNILDTLHELVSEEEYKALKERYTRNRWWDGV